jgi:ribosomal subunit interface protein
MQHPLQITIRDIPHTEILEDQIREKADKLEHFCDRIIRCRVVLDMPQRSQHQGKKYNVRIDIKVPKEELVINRLPNENVFTALDEAFDAARRKLLRHMHRLRGEVKNHHY